MRHIAAPCLGPHGPERSCGRPYALAAGLVGTSFGVLAEPVGAAAAVTALVRALG